MWRGGSAKQREVGSRHERSLVFTRFSLGGDYRSGVGGMQVCSAAMYVGGDGDVAGTCKSIDWRSVGAGAIT
jgi:hypothetical protein